MTRRRGPKDMAEAPPLLPSAPASSDAPPSMADALALAAWTVDPVGWMRTHLGAELWSRQVEICEALVDYREVDVVTGHGVGKDYLAGRIVLWWLYTRPNAIVITTAAKEKQVVFILWGELRNAYSKAKVALGGTMAPVAPELRLGPKHYAIGMVAKDVNAMAGFHEEHVLVIEDEAAGVSDVVDQALMGCAATASSRILRIGNPKCGPTHQFAKSCARGHEPGKHVTIRIASTETPNYVEGREVVPGLSGRDYVESIGRKYGTNSNHYRAMVEAQFPSAASDGLITFDHLNLARARLEDPQPELVTHPKRLGCDVARFGDDLTTVWCGQGPRAWIVSGGIIVKQDGPTIARFLVDTANAEPGGVSSIAVDGGGVGASVVDHLILLQDRGALSGDVEIYVNDFGARASEPHEWADRRTELWWRLRDWLKDEAAIDPDDLLEEELLAPTYGWSGRAKRLESKETLKARMGRSPDRADGLALAVGGHVGITGGLPRLTTW